MIKSYPTLLSAVSRQDLVPPGRVYLLLQAMDATGSGLIPLADVKKRLCNRRSEWHVCSWRWMRELLNKGEGIFWDRHTDDKVWLRSPYNLALALGVGRLDGLPVYIPTDAMLGSIKKVKAHFYAAFESGRKSDTPISQRALRTITGTAERTQREYNQLLDREVTKNYSLTGLEYTPENVYELVINNQRTVLKYVDRRGLRFDDQKAYCLYRLPDTRSRVHERAPRGSVRAINKKLNLAISGERGKQLQFNRMYHHSVETAAKAYGRNPHSPHYWPIGKTPFPSAVQPGKFEAVSVWGCV